MKATYLFLKQKCFPGNLKNKFFYPTRQIFNGYNYQTCFNNGRLCLQSSLSVFWFGFCLLLGLSVIWLVVLFVSGFVCQSGVMFVSGFVCQLGIMFVSGFGCQLGIMFGIGFVCLWVGKYVTSPFHSREGVSVGLCN